MTEINENDQSAAVRNILESVMSGEFNSRNVPTDNVAQLLAAAIAQAGHSTVQVSLDQQSETNQDQETLNINSLVSEKTGSLDQLKVISPNKQRGTCVKLPIKVRKQIIAMRKEGKKCREIAKELKASTSGVRKVWERFLATGMVHDLKPNSGRPRKYPAPIDFEFQYTNEGILPTDDSSHIEYVTLSEPASGTSGSVQLPEEGGVFVEGPMDVPGATVEIVETDPGPVIVPMRQSQVNREELLLKLIKDCPLSVVREDLTKANSSHVSNLSCISKRSLFMESVLGYPFGAAPSPKPFVFDNTEAQVILSDPLNPLGKELLASLGYSTKVYFNMCCLPSPLFDPTKVISDLPFSIGPGGIAKTTQYVLQLLVSLCKDQVSALSHIPSGSGPSVVAWPVKGAQSSVRLGVPIKLSAYWSMLFQFAADLKCCENFLSASPPSAPCLLCHPYQELVKNLEIREPQGDEIWSPTPRAACHSHQLTTIDLAIPSNATDVTKPKRGRPKKTTSENKLIVDGQFEVPVSEPFSEVVTPLPSSTLTLTRESCPIPPTQSSVVPMPSPPVSTTLTLTRESCPIPPTQSSVVPMPSPPVSTTLTLTRESSPIPPTQSSVVPMPSPPVSTSELTVKKEGTLNLPLNETKTTSDAKESNSSTLRRSLRKRAHTPLASISDKTMTQQPQKASTSPRPKSALFSLRRCRRSKRLTNVEQQECQNVTDWSVDDVVEFVASIPRCQCASIFREHEIDGESLLSLDPEMMVKLMDIKTGPALKIYRKIQALKMDSALVS